MDSVTGKMGTALGGLKGQIGTDHQGEDLSMFSARVDTDMMTHSQSTSLSIWIPVMAFKTYIRITSPEPQTSAFVLMIVELVLFKSYWFGKTKNSILK